MHALLEGYRWLCPEVSYRGNRILLGRCSNNSAPGTDASQVYGPVVGFEWHREVGRFSGEAVPKASYTVIAGRCVRPITLQTK